MAYQHGGYTLHVREVELRGGHVQKIYFFSKRAPIVGEPVAELPEDYSVVENRRTGLPYLKRKS